MTHARANGRASRPCLSEVTCEPCQRSKVQRHTKATLGTFSLPDSRFQQIHIDIVGPLPPSNGFLLGIRTAVKEDIKASCAELVYGTTLQLPSDMIETSIIPPCDNIFADHLRNTMRELNPVATSAHGETKFYVKPSLKTCSHVFLRTDSVKPPLCQPYTGPHKYSQYQKKGAHDVLKVTVCKRINRSVGVDRQTVL
ncbi:uncharacterized protein LOC129962374 [Argiope bruennichi]|uniref:uncharacterized protein LOC129962374 n=1 Tax=Argiope bruennichi TaxID=94029 RepID=UPI0024955FFC|nr:uncharacterized protein LOC129962374 [Argiope bruennichi]